jgi:hypothetical protein
VVQSPKGASGGGGGSFLQGVQSGTRFNQFPIYRVAGALSRLKMHERDDNQSPPSTGEPKN